MYSNVDIMQRWMKYSELERSSDLNDANASFNLWRKSERFIHFFCNHAQSWFSRSPLMICRSRSIPQVSVNEAPVKKSDHPEALVGQASKNVETNRTGGSISSTASCLRNTSNWFLADCDTRNDQASIKTEIKQESETASDLDTLYGTYDETTNSITIMYPGEENDGCVGIQECVQEVVSTENVISQDDAVHLTSSGIHLCPKQFSPAYTNSMSPDMSDVDSCGVPSAKQLDCASLSDGGYESHDSPQSHVSDVLFDLWSESFNELFPTLGWQFRMRRAVEVSARPMTNRYVCDMENFSKSRIQKRKGKRGSLSENIIRHTIRHSFDIQ